MSVWTWKPFFKVVEVANSTGYVFLLTETMCSCSRRFAGILPQHPYGDPYFSIYLWLSLDTLESIEILHTDTRNSGRRDGENGSCRDSLIMIMMIIINSNNLCWKRAKKQAGWKPFVIKYRESGNPVWNISIASLIIRFRATLWAPGQ